MKKIISFVFLFYSASLYSKEIAITFDDSPRIATGYYDGPTRAKALIENLKKSEVNEVAFFSVSSQINTEGKNRLLSFSNAGHLIANHTHTHLNFNKTTLIDYISDFKKADTILSVHPNFIKWFRFPYLREGHTEVNRNRMRAQLKENGYFNAYITINNYDWYMEEQFQKEIKINPKLNLEKFKKYYVSTLMEAIEYYDQMSVKHLKRSVKHVILLHETDLAALFIGDLIAELKKNNWTIISPKDAYKDEISKYLTSTSFSFNPGRIGEIANDKGQTTGLWHESCNENYLDERLQKILR